MHPAHEFQLETPDWGPARSRGQPGNPFSLTLFLNPSVTVEFVVPRGLVSSHAR